MPTTINDINLKNLNAMIDAALDGPERKEIKFRKHEFNVKKVEIRESDGRLHINGLKGHHISHEITMAPDDQIYWTGSCVLGAKTLGEADIKVDMHVEKWIPWLTQVAEWVIAHKDLLMLAGGVPKADVTRAQIQESLHLIDIDGGSWRSECNFLCHHILFQAMGRHTGS